MDSFDEKRGMVAKLLAMLKDHASSEVSNGLQKPEGEGDMHGVQVEKVEVIPDHEMDTPTPEHDVITHEMNTGGMVPDSPEGQPDKKAAIHKELGESMAERDSNTTTEHQEPMGTEYPEGEGEPPSMFASFLGKRKKK